MEELIRWLSVGFRYTAMHLDRMLAPYGLNSSQYMYVMRVCERPGVSQDQFLQRFFINPSNVTRAILALEKQGFLERQCNPKDHRTFCLYPTEKAREIYPVILKIRSEWQETLLQGIDPEQRDCVQDGLRRIALNAVKQNKEEEKDNDD